MNTIIDTFIMPPSLEAGEQHEQTLQLILEDENLNETEILITINLN